MHMYAYVCTYIHTHLYIYIYIYIHTYNTNKREATADDNMNFMKELSEQLVCVHIITGCDTILQQWQQHEDPVLFVH